MRIPAACPRCPSGAVLVTVACWVTPWRVHRSVWADEPATCSRGCRLSEAQVVAVLTGPAARAPYQLPLLPGEERAS